MSLPQVIEGDSVGTLLVPVEKLRLLIFAVRGCAWKGTSAWPQ